MFYNLMRENNRKKEVQKVGLYTQKCNMKLSIKKHTSNEKKLVLLLNIAIIFTIILFLFFSFQEPFDDLFNLNLKT